MKQKLRKRNQDWISRQLQRAQKEGMPLSFFINFPSIRATTCNGERLKRRDRLKPDWNRALFHQGWGEVPIVGPQGSVYWFEGFDKEQLPREGANKQVISSQADSLIKISRIWADFFPANTSNQPI